MASPVSAKMIPIMMIMLMWPITTMLRAEETMVTIQLELQSMPGHHCSWSVPVISELLGVLEHLVALHLPGLGEAAPRLHLVLNPGELKRSHVG